MRRETVSPQTADGSEKAKTARRRRRTGDRAGRVPLTANVCLDSGTDRSDARIPPVPESREPTQP